MNVTEQTPAETQPWQLLQQAELRAGSHRGCVFTGGRREGLEGASGMEGLCKAAFTHGCGELGGKRVALGSQCRFISAQDIASIQLINA